MGLSWPFSCPTVPHTFPLWGVAPSDTHPALAASWGAPREELWHFRAEELEDTVKTTKAMQQQLRAFSDLLPFT